MNIEVKVIANAKKREILREGSFFKVKLISMPRDGKANEELIEFLSDIFRVRKSEIKILRGEKDRHKVVYLPVDNDLLANLNSK